MNTPTEHLPWQRSKSSGYAALDLSLVLGSNIGTIDVRRVEREGNFTVYHNGNRISDTDHARRSDAQAEAERYLYALPQFKGSVTAAMIMDITEKGRAGFRAGQSLDQNPYPITEATSRAHWFTGWLEAFAATAAAKVINASVATAQANEMLQHDLAHISGVLRVYQLAMDYALNAENGARFLRLFVANDPTAMAEFYPDWPDYVSEKTGATLSTVN